MSQKIKGFDGIRALAVISVVLTHLHLWVKLKEHGYLAESVVPLVSGTTGVQAFFILSGFLITLLLIREHAAFGRISLKNFIIRRSLRIFPLYILFLLLATIINAVGSHVTTWQSLSYAYFYAYNFVPKEIYTSFLGHTWSLAVEEHFYLVWPLTFLILYSRNRLLILLSLMTFIMGSVAIHVLLVKSGISQHYFVHRWSFVAGYNIAAGCLAALIIESGNNADKYKALFSRPVFFLLGILLYANSVYIDNNSWLYNNVLNAYLRSAGITFMLIWLYLNQQSIHVKILEYPPLKYIGVISYGIYMYQGFFLATGPHRNPESSWPLDQSIGIVLLILAAPLSYHYFEKPFLRLKHRFSVIDRPQGNGLNQ